MEVTIGEEGLTKTWQAKFLKETKCVHCDGDSRIGFVVHEGITEKLPNQPTVVGVCSLHPNEGKGGYWLHDYCAVAIYFCKECLFPTALYNQG